MSGYHHMPVLGLLGSYESTWSWLRLSTKAQGSTQTLCEAKDSEEKYLKQFETILGYSEEKRSTNHTLS